jgi:pyruvate dehydrogenase E1 component alpha subunit
MVQLFCTKPLTWQCYGNYQSFLSLKITVTMGTSERTANHTDIWKLGLGYEMPCGPVDGMVKVAEAMTEAIERARRGDGPTFLEMKTYRYRGHSMSDAQLYRSKDEVEEIKLILLLKF